MNLSTTKRGVSTMANKVIVPNGDDVVMSEEIFNQDSALFMNMMVGQIVIGRVLNDQADRLEHILDRQFIKDILDKHWEGKPCSFADYEMVLYCCI